MIRAFIQARMSSRRFPGKVLAPFRGRPLLEHVISRTASALPKERIVVATSDEPTDEPLALYAARCGVSVFRGPLDDVVLRFQRCLAAFPCEWFFRISADSPLLDGSVVARLEREVRDDLDLVTNVFPRSYPKGQSVELIRARTFAALDPASLTPEEREHATKVFYDHPDRYRIRNVPREGPSRAGENLCVDVLADLERLEASPEGREG